jgi:YbbR domain-containing protein
MVSKDTVVANLGLKALSVALALSLWFYVTYRGQSEMVVDAPVEFKNVPKEMEIMKQSLKKVNLSIRGHERILRSLRPMDSRVVVDLSNAKKGEAVLSLDNDDVVSPRSVQVLRMDPTSVKVTLDQSARKIVAVKAYLIGTPEKGFRVASIRIDPSSVAIEGSETEISRVAFLRTEPLDITGLDESTTFSARLNTDGRNIRTNISEVSVSIYLERIGR